MSYLFDLFMFAFVAAVVGAALQFSDFCIVRYFFGFFFSMRWVSKIFDILHICLIYFLHVTLSSYLRFKDTGEDANIDREFG